MTDLHAMAAKGVSLLCCRCCCKSTKEHSGKNNGIKKEGNDYGYTEINLNGLKMDREADNGNRDGADIQTAATLDGIESICTENEHGEYAGDEVSKKNSDVSLEVGNKQSYKSNDDEKPAPTTPRKKRGLFAHYKRPKDKISPGRSYVYARIPKTTSPGCIISVRVGSSVLQTKCPKAIAQDGTDVDSAPSMVKIFLPKQKPQTPSTTKEEISSISGKLSELEKAKNQTKNSESLEQHKTASSKIQGIDTAYYLMPGTAKPGDELTVQVLGVIYKIRCPSSNVVPGKSQLRFKLSISAHENGSSGGGNKEGQDRTMPFKTFEVTVPKGTQAGQRFTLSAGGIPMSVACPDGTKEGQRLRFKAPLISSETGQTAELAESLSALRFLAATSDMKHSYRRYLRAEDAKFEWLADKDYENYQTKKRTNKTLTKQDHEQEGDDNFGDEFSERQTKQDGTQRSNSLSFIRKFLRADSNSDISKNIEDETKTSVMNIGTSTSAAETLTFVPASEGSLVGTKLRKQRTASRMLNGIDNDSCNNDSDKTVSLLLDVVSLQKPNTKFADKVGWFYDTWHEKLFEPRESGYTRINIRRSHLLHDSMKAVMSMTNKVDMRKVWKFAFIGEPGISGGVSHEWYYLVSEELFHPDLGLLKFCDESKSEITIDAKSADNIKSRRNDDSGDGNGDKDDGHDDDTMSDDHLDYFRFMGQFIGRAIIDGRGVKSSPLARFLCKHLLGLPLCFDDLRHVDKKYYQYLKNLKHLSESGSEEEMSLLCLDFEISVGDGQWVELKEDGADIEVTKDNVDEYITACWKYRLFDQIQPQLAALLSGFHDVIPEELLTIFSSDEFQLLICGIGQGIDPNEWKACTEYHGEFVHDGDQHPTCQWFWEIISSSSSHGTKDDDDMENYNDMKRARILQLVTGSSTIPSSLDALRATNRKRQFNITGYLKDHLLYPRTHPNSNRLDLPICNTKDELREKLDHWLYYANWE